MKNNKTIFLIGFMCSGKSTIGADIAKASGRTFIDLDKKIEEFSRCTISTLFETKGEDFFREIESRVLQTLPVSNAIVATGGGTPCLNENLDYMNSVGITVFLDVSFDQLYDRLLNDRSNRPVLAALEDDELEETAYNLWQMRLPSYKKAQISVNPEKTDLSLLVKKRSLNF